MAKHNIQATSTVCGAAGHGWKPGIAPNYRQCPQCRTVEMFVDGQWVSPTGRTKRSRSVVVAVPPTWMEEVRDLQVKVTRLVDLPPVQTTVSLSHSSTVSGDEHFQAMTRRGQGEVLFQWATNHDYPQLSFSLPAGRTHTIVSGVAAWRVTSFQCPLEVVEAALEYVARYQENPPEMVPAERVKRLELLALATEREWARFVYKAMNPGSKLPFSMVVDGGERGWTRFAYSGRYDHICRACELLLAEKGVIK